MLKRILVAVAIAAASISCAYGQGQFPSGWVQGNPNASAGQALPSSVSSILDRALGSTRGAIIERGASGWVIIAPGATAGVPFVSGGTGADPLYQVLGVVGGGTGLASGTSGGVLCFTSTAGTGSSSLLTQNGVVYGGGAGVCPGSIAAGANGQLLLGVTGSPPQMASMNQDCTITNAGVITCTKTNNVAFAASATTDTTNASNIGSGTLGSARLPSPFTSGTRQGNTSAFQTFAGSAPVSGHAATFDANGNIQDGGGATGTITSCNGINSGTCPEPFSFENCSLSASVGSSLLTVALKDNTGADPSASSPCRIAFRNATAATGSWVLDSVTAALSISTNATGATLGSVNSTAFRFWVVAFDNGGTVVLSLYNASTATSCKAIDETQVQTSVAISGSATAAGTYYTPNGTTLSNKAVKILGYVEYNATGLATAGTYASGPNFINSFSKGMKRPCEPVQFVYKTDTSTSNSAGSTTKVACAGMTASITPTSAANPIKARAYVPWVQANTTAGQAVVQIGRNSSANMVGSAMAGGYNSLTSSNAIAAASLMAYDLPNATSSQAYGVYVFGTASAAAAYTCADTSTGFQFSEELEEIMG